MGGMAPNSVYGLGSLEQERFLMLLAKWGSQDTDKFSSTAHIVARWQTHPSVVRTRAARLRLSATTIVR